MEPNQIFIGENAGIGVIIGHQNILLGHNTNLDNPEDSYMLVIGNWKYKMTEEEYEIIFPAIEQVIETIKEEGYKTTQHSEGH